MALGQQPWPLGRNLDKGFPRLSLASVEADGLSLKYLPPEQQADKEVVLKAVWQNGLALQFASEDLRKDRQVVARAVKRDGNALQFACPELRSDRDTVLKALARTSTALKHVPVELWEDRELMLEAVKQNNRCLSALVWFQDDFDFVVAAMEVNGIALAHASESLRGNREVVLTALMQNGLALEFASPQLRADPEIVLVAVAQNGWAFVHATRELRADPKIAYQAVCLNGSALQHMSDALRSDANEILLQVTKPHGCDTHASPYLDPPGEPFDQEQHREAALKALARKWKVPGWRSGPTPPRSPATDLGRSLMSRTSASQSPMATSCCEDRPSCAAEEEASPAAAAG